MYALVDNSDAIYQFTILLIFTTALLFFVAMYWYSTSLQKTIVDRERARQGLRINQLELERSQMENEVLEAEKQAREERNLRLEQEIELKNQELVSSTLLLSEQSKLMDEIGTILGTLEKRGAASTEVKKLKKVLKTNISIEQQWDNFRIQFEQVYPRFFDLIKQKGARLTQNDLRHCAYIRMQLTTKEIAQLMGINPTSVQIARVRLKKKLALLPEQDLREYITSLN